MPDPDPARAQETTVPGPSPVVPPARPPDAPRDRVPPCDPRALWPALGASRQARRSALLAPLTRTSGPPPEQQHLTWVGDLQQGDGGKGAMTDRLAPAHQIAARVQGGDNAGHTTVFQGAEGGEHTLKNHLLPSGLRHPGVLGVIANGVLVNPQTLAEEVASFAPHVPALRRRLVISDRAHLVLPLHRLVDDRQESGGGRCSDVIGTTRRGIGPANVSKANRIGIRVRDLRDPDLLRRRIEQNVRFFGLPSGHADSDLKWLETHRDLLLSLAADTVALLGAAVEAGYSVLLEGAQGPVLDVEHGTYPYVTTSPTAFYSVTSGTGLDGSLVDHRVGVLKAYQTMVGNGPFVTEDAGELGDRLRRSGEEFGTTTGRSRRCGWLDLAHARWAAGFNRYTSVVVTKLDILDGFDRIGVCVGYQLPNGEYGEFVPDHEYLERCRPLYCWLPGWRHRTRGLTRYDQLPPEARSFLRYIADFLGVEVAAAGTGPADRDLLVDPAARLAGLLPAPAAAGLLRAVRNGREKRTMP
ncbi:adenylosuccinate synthase [Streptomyces sp. WAC 06783]|uniref:adenylosuccinate synthetase n=1 Tax=Streptomyces sp. WAC 06783 TaxID=2203211 RepID=UPI000F742DAE|nr:adenylosuccinate synthetase [Streptomyces sp. WAC 06783]RSO05610.1 adenylosuccinate synthase [Streptomyces sp. WAC 06783]